MDHIEEPAVVMKKIRIKKKPTRLDIPEILIEEGDSILIILKDKDMKTIHTATISVSKGKIQLSL